MRKLTAIAFLLASPTLIAQPENAPAAEERLREAIEMRLSQLDTTREQLEAARQALDEGAEPEAIRERLRGMWREQLLEARSLGPRGDRGQHGRMGDREPGTGGPAMDHPRMGDLTPEQRRRAFEFMKDLHPEAAERIRHLRERGDPDAERGFERLLPRLVELRDLRENDPEMYDLKKLALETGMDVAMRAREIGRLRPEGEQREQMLTEFRGSVMVHFRARRMAQEAEIRRAEQRVAQLRAETEASDLEAEADAAVERLVLRIESWKNNDRRRERRGREGRD